MYRIKVFMSPRTVEESNANITILPAIINPKFPAARNFAVPACELCILARVKKRLTNKTRSSH